MSSQHFLAFWTPSFPELIILLVIALLLFGKRLPEVARSLGKGIVEFKKGVKGIEDDVDRSQYEPPKSSPSPTPPTPDQVHSTSDESRGVSS